MSESSLKRVFCLTIGILVLIVVLYCVNLKFNICGTSEDWIDIATFLAGIAAPITTVATLAITYLIYRYSQNEHISERHFEKIVDNYMDLQKDYKLLCSCDDERVIEDCIMKIKTHALLIRHYLIRFPKGSHSVKDFDLILNDIWFEPTRSEYYKSLTREFESFFFYANQKHKRSIKPIKNNKGEIIDIDY